jgi:transcriptional regulator with XRE-family HTH domain
MVVLLTDQQVGSTVLFVPPLDAHGLATAFELSGLTVGELTRRLNDGPHSKVSESYVRAILRGDRRLKRNPVLRRRIADALGVPLYWIEVPPAGSAISSVGEPAAPRVRAPRQHRTVSVSGRRPVQPEPFVRAAGGTLRTIAERLGLRPSSASLLCRPFTIPQAEDYCRRLGLDPREVWKSWPPT